METERCAFPFPASFHTKDVVQQSIRVHRIEPHRPSPVPQALLNIPRIVVDQHRRALRHVRRPRHRPRHQLLGRARHVLLLPEPHAVPGVRPRPVVAAYRHRVGRVRPERRLQHLPYPGGLGGERDDGRADAAAGRLGDEAEEDRAHAVGEVRGRSLPPAPGVHVHHRLIEVDREEVYFHFVDMIFTEERERERGGAMMRKTGEDDELIISDRLDRGTEMGGGRGRR